MEDTDDMYNPSDSQNSCSSEDEDADVRREHWKQFTPHSDFERKMVVKYGRSLRWFAILPALLDLRDCIGRNRSPQDDPELVQREHEIRFMGGDMTAEDLEASREYLANELRRRKEKQRREKAERLAREEMQKQAKRSVASALRQKYKADASAARAARDAKANQEAASKLATLAAKRDMHKTHLEVVRRQMRKGDSKYVAPDSKLDVSMQRWRESKMAKPKPQSSLSSESKTSEPKAPEAKSATPVSEHRIKKRTLSAPPQTPRALDDSFSYLRELVRLAAETNNS